MKRILIIASVLLVTSVQAIAQKEFKLAKNSGKLVINGISNLTVEGYDGKDIIFTTTNKKEVKEDPRAAGLSALSNSGFDNTGIGLNVSEKENLTLISLVEKSDELGVKIKLPSSVALSIKTTGLTQRDSTIIAISNIKAEIDASAQYEHFKLTNVTGPVSLKTLYGNIEGKLTQSFKGPISLVSVYGFVDVTVPENAKADMSISTQHETLYAAKDLKLVVDENPPKENQSLSAVAVNGKLEGLKVITLDGTSKAKGTGTNNINESLTTTAPVAVVSGKPVTVIDKFAQAKNAAAPTIVGNGTYTYSYSPSSSSFWGSNRGTTINGKLNGGGEKIILKSTYGKIYLRK